MDHIMMQLFERAGMLLLVTFILTRVPWFRQVIERKITFWNGFGYSLLFGCFAILGTYAGIVTHENHISTSQVWISPVAQNEAIAHSSVVGIVIGGLLGGSWVGAFAGLIAGVHLYGLGGFAGLAGALSLPFIGVMAGLIARFFAEEKIISPFKSLFVGVFAPIIYMCFILAFAFPASSAIALVNTIGLPMVITNSISIAIFTTMLHLALREEERTAAVETQRSLQLAEQALPYLNHGWNATSAPSIAQLLHKETSAYHVAVTNRDSIFYITTIKDRDTSIHQPSAAGLELQWQKHFRYRYEPYIILEYGLLFHQDERYDAAILIPVIEEEEIVGTILLFYPSSRTIRAIEMALARGIGKLFSYELNAARGKRMTAMLKESELRRLHSQIQPHFLFNTLNSILSLIRIDPDRARHITIQLAQHLRFHLKSQQPGLIPISQELDALRSYLDIVQVRFEEQMNVEIRIDARLEHILIPPTTLQPLVENSVIHGFKQRKNTGFIHIDIFQDERYVYIQIEDNGQGMPDEMIQKLGKQSLQGRDESNGTGVYNVCQRLYYYLGDEATFRCSQREGGGVRIILRIPSFH
jgi:two-component system sensor histidine kinase LytS